jgi:hypothetical protein
MYRRAVFETVGVFDTTLDAAEDWDLYLRVARQYPVCRHGEVIAEYRQYGTNTTRDPAVMLKAVITALRRQRSYAMGKRRYKKAYKAGISFWRAHYGAPLAQEVQDRLGKRDWKRAVKGLLVLLRYHPCGFASVLRSYPTSMRFTRFWSKKPVE